VTALEASIVAKRFGGHAILSTVRLTLARGERVAVVGPSGCGKSTLLRILAGLDGAYAGDVRVDGHPMTRPDPLRVGVMFQEPRLLPWMDVIDNVKLAATSHPDAEARALSLLEAVGLATRQRAFPRELSGGMAQRVALARALYLRPPILLLDEPFSAVDALARLRLRALVDDVTRQHGATVLLVTHDVEEAVGFTDRILVMGAAPGRVVAEVATPRARSDDGDVAHAATVRSVMDLLHRAHAEVPGDR
jgi:sulfonate transport system ATP-binding protein